VAGKWGHLKQIDIEGQRTFKDYGKVTDSDITCMDLTRDLKN
jgi:hypothetical protein